MWHSVIWTQWSGSSKYFFRYLKKIQVNSDKIKPANLSSCWWYYCRYPVVWDTSTYFSKTGNNSALYIHTLFTSWPRREKEKGLYVMLRNINCLDLWVRCHHIWSKYRAERVTPFLTFNSQQYVFPTSIVFRGIENKVTKLRSSLML